jgi:sporulation protein YlmC with PRC-barrel domain
MLKLTTAAVMAACFAVPVLAQTPPARSENRSGAAMNAPATQDVGRSPTAGGYNSPSARNPVMTDHGTLRTSKIVGSAVYNDKDEKIGTVDDLVVDKDNQLSAVISVGGFLGMGSKMVKVPFDKLQFGNTKESSDNRVVMPGMTKDSLTGMPDYQYTNRG